MELTFDILMSIALIPACLLVYALFSSTVQLLFNKSFDEESFNNKWQLNNYACYVMVGAFIIMSFNNFFTMNGSIEIASMVSVIVSLYWYMAVLVVYNVKNIFIKLT